MGRLSTFGEELTIFLAEINKLGNMEKYASLNLVKALVVDKETDKRKYKLFPNKYNWEEVAVILEFKDYEVEMLNPDINKVKNLLNNMLAARKRDE